MKSLIVPILFLIGLVLVGCSKTSRVEAKIPGDGSATLTGQAADEYTKTLIQNTQTAQGRVNEVFDKLKSTVLPLFAFLLIGGAWAFYSKSKFAAIIPITAGIGLALIFFLGSSIEWIMNVVKWGFPVVVAVIMAWRGIVYQKERNEAEMKKKEADEEAVKAIAALKNNSRSP
jgi:hypothetical protein